MGQPCVYKLTKKCEIAVGGNRERSHNRDENGQTPKFKNASGDSDG
jgi:hypothetical protein